MGIPISPNAELPDGAGVELIAVLLLHNLPVLHADGRVAVQPPCNNKTANRPAPDKNCDRRGDEQSRHEHQQRDTDPEERKYDGGAQCEKNG
ncbi:unnamed protein product [Fusarium graminearum]|nr:hypothetical protein HG531_009856 [Fusarium graminearum]CAF3634535.1 unnamed protein product [Fusarium graminearum]CAG1996391.1 unnamed protein product [Fusarium graminearum]VTO84143.1 unnamed protein product [Fusarium graminearum]